MTAQQQLRRAAELIEERGHVKGRFDGENGEICMAKALAEAAEVSVYGYSTAGLQDTPAFQEGGLIVGWVCDANNYDVNNAKGAAKWLRDRADVLDRETVLV